MVGKPSGAVRNAVCGLLTGQMAAPSASGVEVDEDPPVGRPIINGRPTPPCRGVSAARPSALKHATS